MGKKEGSPPLQHKTASKLFEPQTLKWIFGFSIVGGGLSFACAFIAVSAGIVANFPAEPVYVKPAFSMSSALSIALVGAVGVGISIVVFIGASAILAVKLLSNQQTDTASQSGGKEEK